MNLDRWHISNWESEIRILVSCALPLGQAVFITNTSHQVPQTCDPSTRLFSSAGYQVQRLHVFSVIQAEAAVWVKAALWVTLEDLWLFALAYLSDRVNGDCDTQIQSAVSIHLHEKEHFENEILLLGILFMASTCLSFIFNYIQYWWIMQGYSGTYTQYKYTYTYSINIHDATLAGCWFMFPLINLHFLHPH